MTALRESLRAPIENNDNAAPREERLVYGPVLQRNVPIHDNGPAVVIALMVGVVLLAALVILLIGAVGFYDLWSGVQHPRPLR